MLILFGNRFLLRMQCGLSSTLLLHLLCFSKKNWLHKLYLFELILSISTFLSYDEYFNGRLRFFLMSQMTFSFHFYGCTNNTLQPYYCYKKFNMEGISCLFCLRLISFSEKDLRLVIAS